MHIDVYKASAGSGKTFTLTQKYLGLLKKGTSHKQVLAVTFTNKATTEMKERIVETLAKIVKGEMGLQVQFHRLIFYLRR